MAERFGNNGAAGVNYLMLSRSNWFVMAEQVMIFSRVVREDNLFSNIATASGNLINSNGEFSKVRLGERGSCSSLRAGKVFPLKPSRSRSGFFVSAGAGFFQHRIYIDDVGNLTPPLQGAYKKGYDRYSNGPAFVGSAGFLLVSRNKIVNGFAALDLIWGFTRSRRSWNFDTMSADTRARTDVLAGFRLGFMIRIYRRSTDKFYYY